MLMLGFLVVWYLLMHVADGKEPLLLDPNRRIVKRGDNIRVCGRMLVDTLNLLCEGEYYDPNEGSSSRRGKRAPRIDPYSNWIAVALTRSTEQQSSNLQPQPTQQQHVRLQRGVVDECCRKSCSPSTLLSYCRQ